MRRSPFADSIKPFQQTKDGRGAFAALSAQYASLDKWEAQLKRIFDESIAYEEVEGARKLFLGTVLSTSQERVCLHASLH